MSQESQVPLEVLESCKSSLHTGSPKKEVLTPAKDWIRNKVDELASEREDKYAKKQKLPSSFYVGCHSRVWSKVWVGLPTSKALDLGWAFSFK